MPASVTGCAVSCATHAQLVDGRQAARTPAAAVERLEEEGRWPPRWRPPSTLAAIVSSELVARPGHGHVAEASLLGIDRLVCRRRRHCDEARWAARSPRGDRGRETALGQADDEDGRELEALGLVDGEHGDQRRRLHPGGRRASDPAAASASRWPTSRGSRSSRTRSPAERTTEKNPAASSSAAIARRRLTSTSCWSRPLRRRWSYRSSPAERTMARTRSPLGSPSTNRTRRARSASSRRTRPGCSTSSSQVAQSGTRRRRERSRMALMPDATEAVRARRSRPRSSRCSLPDRRRGARRPSARGRRAGHRKPVVPLDAHGRPAMFEAAQDRLGIGVRAHEDGDVRRVGADA